MFFCFICCRLNENINFVLFLNTVKNKIDSITYFEWLKNKRPLFDTINLMKLLTTTEVAAIIKQSERTVQRITRSGKLKRVNPQCSSNFLFREKDVENYLQKKSSKHSESANISKPKPNTKK